MGKVKQASKVIQPAINFLIKNYKKNFILKKFKGQIFLPFFFIKFFLSWGSKSCSYKFM